jgi:hypothetical protein
MMSNPCIWRRDNVLTWYQCTDEGFKEFFFWHRHVYLSSRTGWQETISHSKGLIFPGASIIFSHLTLNWCVIQLGAVWGCRVCNYKRRPWIIVLHGSVVSLGPVLPPYRGFMIPLRHTTLGRFPLDEVSALRCDLYLTTHNTHNRHTSMPRRDLTPQFQQASGHWDRRPCLYILTVLS